MPGADVRVGNYRYLLNQQTLLRNGITKNTDKRLIDRYSGILTRILIDMGYNENYIYNCIHEKFFHSKVLGLDSFEDFIKCFSFEINTYDVYIGFSMDLSKLVPLFSRLRAEDIEIINVDIKSLPTGIKSKGQKTILCFKKVPGLDVYSAYESVREISKVIVNSFGYYNHIKNGIKIYGQVVNGKGKIITISDKDLLKHRVSSLSHEESKINTEKMLDVIFSNLVNLKDISRVTEIHNSAIWSNSSSDSLLSLWSVLEKLSVSEEGDNINKVKTAIIPFLSSTYIEKIVKTCMLDIKRWDMNFFEQNVQHKDFNDLESTFAFLVLDECEQNRQLLYSKTELYPLLRYRVYFLNAQLKNTKGYMSLISEHERRVEWQIHRIYRARNYIIHDGRIVNNSSELVINLHTYVDTVFTKIIDLLAASPYSHDAIEDVMIEHKLNSSIMREKITNRSKETIVSSELKQYLYFVDKGGEKDGIDIHTY